MTPIAARLRQWRKNNGISQQQATAVFARHRIPITLAAIRAWEQGRSISDMAEFVLSEFLLRHAIIEDPPPRYPGCRPARAQADKDTMRAMHEHGMTLASIGQKYGITESGVSRILSDKPKKTQKKIRA